jgi:hypothetical protein
MPKPEQGQAVKWAIAVLALLNLALLASPWIVGCIWC